MIGQSHKNTSGLDSLRSKPALPEEEREHHICQRGTATGNCSLIETQVWGGRMWHRQGPAQQSKHHARGTLRID